MVVDGIDGADRGLPGKPAPDAFLLGAELLGVDPARSVVVEDAVSGVAAGAAGSFAVVIGVDRGAGTAALIANGATFVVDDLAEIAGERGIVVKIHQPVTDRAAHASIPGRSVAPRRA